MFPEERTTGLGCIPERRNVSYQCTVTDTTNPPIGSTTWSGSAFQCPSIANQISLPHSQFSSRVSSTCGSLRATALETNGSNYVSQLSLTATSLLNGTTLSCSLSDTEIVSDVLVIGGESISPQSLQIIPTFTYSCSPSSWTTHSHPLLWIIPYCPLESTL